MISRGVEISIAGRGREMVHGQSRGQKQASDIDIFTQLSQIVTKQGRFPMTNTY